MVENRFVGIKSRGVYETPGLTILLAAHKDIEGIAMDREVMRLRDMLTPKFAEFVYNGFWFSPEMDFLMAAIDKSQEVVDGVVRLALYKGNVYADRAAVAQLALRPGPELDGHRGRVRPDRLARASSPSTPSG